MSKSALCLMFFLHQGCLPSICYIFCFSFLISSLLLLDLTECNRDIVVPDDDNELGYEVDIHPDDSDDDTDNILTQVLRLEDILPADNVTYDKNKPPTFRQVFARSSLGCKIPLLSASSHRVPPHHRPHARQLRSERDDVHNRWEEDVQCTDVLLIGFDSKKNASMFSFQICFSLYHGGIIGFVFQEVMCTTCTTHWVDVNEIKFWWTK